MTAVAAPPRATLGAAVPYLAVADARAALDWYVDVFGAELDGEPIVMPDGTIGHAQLIIGGGKVYLADASPDLGVVAPRPGEANVSLMLPVSDADAVRERAVARGATGDRPPYDGYGERHAWIVDPFGHRWGLTSPLVAADGFRAGDLTHVSVRTPDAERAGRFYGQVLGWQVVDGRVATATPSVGVWTASQPELLRVHATDDIEAALARVFDAGGTPGEVRREPYGLRADCLDDQGVPFALHETAGAGTRPPANGARTGDLSYLTLLVGDSARFRAFHTAVFGWTFTPGRVEDGWEVVDSRPMIGLQGGHDEPAAVPMWRVADIDAAVAAVRDLGGTATDVTTQPYGRSSECTDDQGSRFYLGEM
ncbi:VOC family protein [Jatrophihabitans fulvus]